MHECKICNNQANNRIHFAREMMLGLRDEFRYVECGNCNTLQLLDVPKDFSRYYPTDYYSFRPHSGFKTYLRHQWAAYAYGTMSPLGWAVSKLFSPYGSMLAVRRAKPAKAAKILDVGCGSGQLIQDLYYLGFRNVSGADPYIERDIHYENGPVVLKKRLAEVEGQFELIMLHHSFEHMDEPIENFKHLARLLAPGGQVILRIPVAGSYAWKTYGVNWMHLDAPRHLFLHTPRGVEMMASQAGLAIESTLFESDESQFLGSEQYAKDIPTVQGPSYAATKLRMAIGNPRMRKFQEKARELNEEKQGDMGCFYIRKPLESLRCTSVSATEARAGGFARPGTSKL